MFSEKTIIPGKKPAIEKTGSAATGCFKNCMLTKNFKNIVFASSELSHRDQTPELNKSCLFQNSIS